MGESLRVRHHYECVIGRKLLWESGQGMTESAKKLCEDVWAYVLCPTCQNILPQMSAVKKVKAKRTRL